MGERRINPRFNINKIYKTVNIINPYRFGAGGGGGGSYDADAQAFIDAVATLSTAQEEAIDDLVVGLKANGTWSKYDAIYPFIGGTSSAHKWNLKDPRDLDAAYRLTFNGTITHDANGYTGDGSSGYLNTHILGSDIWSDGNIGINFYSLTDSATNSEIFGFVDASWRIRIRIRYTNDLFYSDVINGSSGRLTASNTSSQGYYSISKIASNDHRIFRNGSQMGINTSTVTGVSTTTVPFYFSALNNLGTAEAFSGYNFAFLSFSDGLTSTEVADDYTTIQAYQTALSRNV